MKSNKEDIEDLKKSLEGLKLIKKVLNEITILSDPELLEIKANELCIDAAITHLSETLYYIELAQRQSDQLTLEMEVLAAQKDGYKFNH